MIRQINKNNNRRQTFLSIIILSVLLLIGVGIFTAQFQYNQSVLQKEAFLPEHEPDKASKQLSLDSSFTPLPKGIQPLTAVEIFDKNNLSDKIDGKAELYLNAGFTRLVSQRFKDELNSELWMEVFVYDMSNSQNAFSVFSSQRREDAEQISITRYAYKTSNALFMVHSRYYVEIIASQNFEKIWENVKIIAKTFLNNTPDEAVTINETELFPEQELIKNSIALIAADAFGYDGFNKIYTAQYELNGQKLMAYISNRGTPAESEKMALAYTKFLLSYGGRNIEEQLPIKGAKLIEILDSYEIVFSYGSYLAGIREAAKADQAKMLASRLYKRINEVKP